MAGRVVIRVEAYCQESGTAITVLPWSMTNQAPEEGLTNEEVKEA
jgi:hypothetical protein